MIKFLQKISYLYIFLLPLQTRFIWKQGFLNSEHWEAATYSLYITDFILLILFLGFIIAWQKRESRYTLRNNYQQLFKILQYRKFRLSFIFSIAFVIWSGISILWSFQKVLAVFHFIQIIKVLGFIIILIGLQVSIKRVLKIFVVTGVIQAIWAIIQFYTQSQFGSGLLGVSSLRPDILGVSVVEYVENAHPVRILRAYGGFPHPNILGGFIAMSLIVCAYVLSTAKNFKQQIVWGGFLLVIGIGLLLSFSRSAWLVVWIELFIVLTVLSVLYKLKVFKSKEIGVHDSLLKISQYKKTYSFILGGFFIIFCVAFIFSPNIMKTRFGIGEVQRLEEKSIEERITVMEQARNILVDNVLFGVGLGNYEHSVGLVDNFFQKPWGYQPVHNIYLLIFVELGFIGLLLFGLFLLNLMLGIADLIIQKGITLDLLVSISLFEGLLILGLFDHYLWTTHVGIMLFGVILGQLLYSSYLHTTFQNT